jgi:ribosome-associated translation inhibitor RaiA
MRSMIQVMNAEVEAGERRKMESELQRAFVRHTRAVDSVTAYLTEDAGAKRCRVALLAVDGMRLSAEGKADDFLQALQQATSQLAAALQREEMRKHDPRMNRGPRGAPPRS